LTDLFGSGDFPVEILDPVQAAAIVVQRLSMPVSRSEG